MPDQVSDLKLCVAAWWESIENLEILVDIKYGDYAPPGAMSRPYTSLKYLFSGEDKFIQNYTAHSTSGISELSPTTIQDGAIRYLVVPFKGHPESISEVRMRVPTATRSHFANEMLSPYLWVLIPDGRSLPWHLEHAHKIEFIKGSSEDDCRITTESRGMQIEIVLDAAHDWLPSSIKLAASKKRTWTVESFVKVDGRWLPEHGYYFNDDTPDAKQTFELREAHINRAIPPDTFACPDIPDGAIIDDGIKGTRIIKGSALARDRLIEANTPPTPPLTSEDSIQPNEDSGQPIEAGDAPTSRVWQGLLIGVALVAFATVAMIAWRRTRSR